MDLCCSRKCLDQYLATIVYINIYTVTSCNLRRIYLERNVGALILENFFAVQLHVAVTCHPTAWEWQYKINKKLDSRLLCNAMGHPGWSNNTHYNTPGMHFWAIFTKTKASHNSGENYHIGNNLHLCSRLPIRSFS